MRRKSVISRGLKMAALLIAVLGEQGITQRRSVVTPRGDVVGEEFVMHPGVAELRKLDAQLVTLRASLGLDPMSRARAGLEQLDPGRDAIDELQGRRQRRLAAVGLAS